MNKSLRKFMYRKLPDGREKWGFGMIAIFTLGPLLLLIFSLRGERQGMVDVASRGVDIPAVGRAVQRVEEVEEDRIDKGLQSDKGIEGVRDTSTAVQAVRDQEKAAEESQASYANALDAATSAALKEPERERAVISDDSYMPGDETHEPGSAGIASGSSDGGFMSPLAPQGNRSDQGGGQNTQSPSGIVYRRIASKSPTPTTPNQPANGSKTEESKFTPGTFLPRGYYIDLYLFDLVRTDVEQPLVTFVIARDVKFRGKVYLPFGTRLLGTAGGQPEKGQRISFSLTSIQFPDGTELPVTGVVKGIDGSAGLPAYYIPPPLWTEFSGYVNDFIAGYLNLLQAHQQNNLAIRLGSVDVGYQPPTFDPKLEALSATSEVIRNFASKQLAELQARTAPYLVCPAGTVAKFQLLAPLSMKVRGVGVANDDISVGFPPVKNPSDIILDTIPGVDPKQLKSIQEAIARSKGSM